MNRFEPRLVSYIDVLGLSAALCSQSGGKRYAEALDSILSPILRNPEEPWHILNHIFTGEEVEIELAIPITNRSRITAISDAILLSIPFGPRISAEKRMRRILDCLQTTYSIQRSLLALGLRTRGGIAIGGLIHKSHLVLGDGLVRAYNLESQTAIFPRVVIDRAIIKMLVEGPIPRTLLFRNRVAHTIRQDSDGLYFVDYLSINPAFSGTRMEGHITRICTDLNSEIANNPPLRVEQKLRWMLGCIHVVNTEIRCADERKYGHAEGYFSDRFYRSKADFRELYDKLEAGEITTENIEEALASSSSS